MTSRALKQFLCRTMAVLCTLALLIPASALADSPGAGRADPTNEKPIPAPYEAIPYSQIEDRLREIEANSSRVKVEVLGQSAGGRDLFLVTVSDPEALGRLGKYQAIRHTMLTDPEKALDMIEAEAREGSPNLIEVGSGASPVGSRAANGWRRRRRRNWSKRSGSGVRELATCNCTRAPWGSNWINRPSSAWPLSPSMAQAGGTGDGAGAG